MVTSCYSCSMSSLFVLGREQALAAAEVMSVLQAKQLHPRLQDVASFFMVIDTAKPLPADFLTRLGGTERIAKMIGSLPKLWQPAGIAKFLSPTPNKYRLGISCLLDEEHRQTVTLSWLKDFAFDLKNMLREQGSRVRFITPQAKHALRLNAAQVIFNRLTTEPHRELLLIAYKSRYIVAQTTQIQDIQSYARRDSERPVRDARIGMLPPKLAQIMINLTASQLPSSTPLSFLDPFCGLGTIVQEGWLLGHRMTGSDASTDMVKGSEKNLDWISSAFPADLALRPTCFHQDATQPFPTKLANTFDAIITEPHLGPPLSTPLSPAEYQKKVTELGQLYQSFFQQAQAVLKPKGYILFVLPMFRGAGTRPIHWRLFPGSFIDDLTKLGFRPVKLLPQSLLPFFSLNERGNLTYARPDALVGRELTFWQKFQ